MCFSKAPSFPSNLNHVLLDMEWRKLSLSIFCRWTGDHVCLQISISVLEEEAGGNNCDVCHSSHFYKCYSPSEVEIGWLSKVILMLSGNKLWCLFQYCCFPACKMECRLAFRGNVITFKCTSWGWTYDGRLSFKIILRKMFERTVLFWAMGMFWFCYIFNLHIIFI